MSGFQPLTCSALLCRTTLLLSSSTTLKHSQISHSLPLSQFSLTNTHMHTAFSNIPPYYFLLSLSLTHTHTPHTSQNPLLVCYIVGLPSLHRLQTNTLLFKAEVLERLFPHRRIITGAW